jgi:GntR family transcriptional regulator, uxu operon transcriptional repressor
MRASRDGTSAMHSAEAADAELAERGRGLAGRVLAESARAGLRAGARLPTERRLADELGVTRSTVRHALAILQAEGRISREVGRGTFLRRAPDPLDEAAGGAAGAWVPAPGEAAQAGTADGQGFAPADVMAIRGLLEPQAMPLVVAWATAADFDEMERCLAGGDRAVSYEEFETWDLALHRCIMAASHSQLLGTLYAAIEAARHGQVWGDLKRRSASRERRLEYQEDHRALVAALRARDSAGAVAAMRRHLSRVADHLLGQGQWSGPAD